MNITYNLNKVVLTRTDKNSSEKEETKTTEEEKNSSEKEE